jgi:ABC-2 type transport system ATP-binding protein
MKLEIKHIEKKFQRTPILKDICLTAESGTCVGLLGCNGSGKSTLLSILAGILQADGGEFLLDDQKPNADQIGYVPQGTPLMEELTAWDNLLLWYSRVALEQELKDGVLHL